MSTSLCTRRANPQLRPSHQRELLGLDLEKLSLDDGQSYPSGNAKSRQHLDAGGRAFLDLEKQVLSSSSSDSTFVHRPGQMPWDGGIRYTTMAPGKRFRDMHLLSGGEKTMAALALLFTVQKWQRCPVFILDEVDASLDFVNVGAVRSYIVGQGQGGFQAFTISLKDRFFSGSDGLVGVWQDRARDCSGVLTWDLRRYRVNLLSRGRKSLLQKRLARSGAAETAGGGGGGGARVSAELGDDPMDVDE